MTDRDIENKQPQEENQQATAPRYKRWLKNPLQGLSKKDRKLFYQLSALLVIGIILMNGLYGHDEAEQTPPTSTTSVTGEATKTSTSVDGEADLEKKIEQALASIKGAGEVDVIVYYSASKEQVFSYDTQQSSSPDAEGGSAQSQAQLSVVDDQPVLLKENAATIQGVVVIAQGAGEPVVAERLYQAVSRLLGLGADRIAIVEGEFSF